MQQNDNSPGGVFHLLDAFSRKQRRVVRSTFGAELNALVDAHDVGRVISMALEQISREGLTAKDLCRIEETGPYSCPVEAATDCRSLFDALSQSELHPPTGAPQILPLYVLKEGLTCGRMRALWWTPTEDMVADGLTKGACARGPLIALMSTGIWSLVHKVSQFTERSRVRNGLR